MHQRSTTCARRLILAVLMSWAAMLTLEIPALCQEEGLQVQEFRQWMNAQDERIRQLESRLEEKEGPALSLPDLAYEDQSTQPAGQASNASTESRLDRIEELLPDIETRETDFFEALSTVSKRIVNGRLHLDVWSFPQDSPGVNVIENGDPALDPEDQLLYRRIRFGVHGTVPPENMSYRVEIEFSGQDGSQFRDAWLGWDDLVFFRMLRLGNQKRPYGLDHLNSSNFNVFLERPFVVDAFNEDNRRFGLASHGVSENQAFNWQFGIYNLTPVQDVGSIIGDEHQVELAWRLANTWWYDEKCRGRSYAHWGLAGTFAFPNGNAPDEDGQANAARFRTRPEGRSGTTWLDTGTITGADTYQILGLESVLNLGRLQFAGEFMNLWLQRPDRFGRDLYLHGGYLYASYFLTGEHLPWNRRLGILGRVEPFGDFFCSRLGCDCVKHGPGAWQVAARLSYADFNDEDILGGIGQSATFALNWYWNAHARMQFNYIFGRVDDRLAELAAGGAAVVSGDYQISGVRFMIDF